ncbi:hypothetical protein [Nakamurella leprariae]|uniref:Uncharacterized protein n=1 Tax=Nakamurella leprariae TaxID=2803911 RepID=A0A939BXC3_9ACTN|nr:hypothetical protein [Nakamurella leprariae]MBM9468413.1 hypothetical protein [Nakamurella leprariae]
MPADPYADLLGRRRPARGERAALEPHLADVQRLFDRSTAVRMIDPTDGRVLLQPLLLVVTDVRLIAAAATGGFRPSWEVVTFPYGHLDPEFGPDAVQPGGPADASATVRIPVFGRRQYQAQFADTADATAFSVAAAEALGTYRRERMGLPG